MADLCADGPSRFEVGLLSKQAEAWVLVTLAREGDALKGFSFCTLERIGGTPSVLIGLASVKRTAKRDTVLRAIMPDQFRRAVLAFPDEDVLVGTRFTDAAGFEAFKTLERHRPPPRPQGHGRGAGLGSSPGQALRHRDRRLRRPVLHRHGRRHLPAGARPRDARSPRRSTRPSPRSSTTLDAARGRLADRLRLGDGRGPRQAGLGRRRHRPSGPRVTMDFAGRRPPPPHGAGVRAATRSTADVLDRLLDLARRAPVGRQQPGHSSSSCSTGPAETARYWDVALPAERRATFRLARPARRARCSSSRVGRSRRLRRALRRARQGRAPGLGEGADAWPVPYWWVDAGMAVHDAPAGRGRRRAGRAASSACSSTRPRVQAALGVPADRRPVGTIALGYARTRRRPPERARRRAPAAPLDDVVHRGRW